jgi:hypothetical protein
MAKSSGDSLASSAAMVVRIVDEFRAQFLLTNLVAQRALSARAQCVLGIIPERSPSFGWNSRRFWALMVARDAADPLARALTRPWFASLEKQRIRRCCRTDVSFGLAYRLEPESNAKAVPNPHPVRFGLASRPRRRLSRVRGVTVHLVVEVDVDHPRRRPALDRYPGDVRQNDFCLNNGSARGKLPWRRG